MLHTDEKPIEEVNDQSENIRSRELLKQELEEAASETKNVFEDEQEMELLSDLKKQTDKDIDKTVVQNSNSNEAFSSSDNLNTDISQPKRTNIQYQNHELVAKLTVAALNVAMGMVLQIIADDWTEEAEKKYTLSATRKAEILEPLTLVLEQSKSKYNPVVILVITVLVAYVPMFVSAFRTRKEKNKLSKGKKSILKKIGIETDSEEETKEEIKSEIENFGKVKEVVKIKEIFKMTAGQQKRLKEIKSKRGKRSTSDTQFIAEMGLTGLV